jgi:hypothetical protein
MRYREFVNFHNIEVKYFVWNNTFLGDNSTSISTLPNAVGYYNKTWDVVTPNFRKRIKDGEIIVNPYTNGRYSISNSTDGIAAVEIPLNGDGSQTKYERFGAELTEKMGAAGKGLTLKPLFTPSEIDSLASEAGTKARANSSQKETDGLVFLAELGKTFRTLLNPLGNFMSLITTIRGRKNADIRSRGLSLVDYISKEWLKYRYGIMPIMYDVDGIVKALEKDKSKGLQHSRGGANRTRKQETPPTSFVFGNFDHTYKDTFTHEVVVKCGLMYKAELGTDDFLGLNLRSIPSTAWELIPFSFVIDWFANVQTYVNALSARVGAPEKGGYKVVTETLTASRAALGSTIIPASAGLLTLTKGMSGIETHIYRKKQREIGCPGASLQSKIDLNLFNWKDRRVLDAFALIFQILGRR